MTERPVRSTSHQRWTLALVCGAMFMLLLDVTVVSVALGGIQRDLDADLAELQWVVDAYTLPLATLLLTAATMSDRLGRRRVFLLGMAVFTVGSLACAVAWSSLTLDLTRAVQGVGGALLFGTGLPLLAAAYPDARQRAGAIGIFGATLAAATAVGPLVGGALVEGPGWRWIFLVNIPLGVAAIVVGRRVLAESRATHARRADWPGTALLTAGIFALLLALVRGNADGWGSTAIVALFVTAGVALAGFVARQATAREPMLDLALFRSLPFTGVVVAAFAMAVTLVGSTPYLSLYVQNTLGFGALEAGLRFLPLTVTAFVAAPVAARLGRRVPPWLLISGSLAVTGAGFLLMTGLDADSRWTALVLGFVLAGVGMGVSSSATSQAAVSAVEPARAGMATGAVNTMRQVGVAAGVAVLGAVFSRRATDAAQAGLTAEGLPPAQVRAASDAIGAGAGTGVADGLPQPAHDIVAEAARAATAAGLDDTLLLGGITALVAAVLTVILIRRPRLVETAATEPLVHRETVAVES